MFDIGATEILVIAVVAILVVGPKDLPGMLRTVGTYVSKLRGMAREFQQQFEDAARDTGLDDVRQGISSVRDFTPGNQIKKAFDTVTEEVESVKTEVEKPLDAASATADADTAAKATADKAPVAKKAPAKKPARKTAARKSKTTAAAKKKPAATKRAAPRKRATAPKASTEG